MGIFSAFVTASIPVDKLRTAEPTEKMQLLELIEKSCTNADDDAMDAMIECLTCDHEMVKLFALKALRTVAAQGDDKVIHAVRAMECRDNSVRRSRDSLLESLG